MTDVELLTHAVGWMQDAIGRQSHLGAFALLYLEESGIPLPAPGDVFVIYVGVHVPLALPFWFAAWLGLICVVVLGATNLYLVSRVVGRRVLENRFARLAHLTPARLALAESRFQRRGVLAIIFGRHIPGFRVPLTVVAGTLKFPYRLFVPSVAVSTAIWLTWFGPSSTLWQCAHSRGRRPRSVGSVTKWRI